MRLKPSPLVPGLWQTESFQPRCSATYAFVVGASRYVNFEPPSPESFGMGSLAVSALTAYRFFRWLGTRYRTDDDPAPAVQCRLLLSPTEDEQELLDHGSDKIVVGDAPGSTARAPTLIALMSGLQAWFNELTAVKDEQAERSRIVFFYSGHGLEIDPGRQLLLPCDYRYTEAEQNNAISTENIRDAMRKLAIWSQFFFLDACRSDIASMHELASASGLPVLPVSRIRNQRNSAPVLYASASGDNTYQPPQAKALDDLGSVTFFGKAVLSALELSSAVKPPFAPVVSGQPPLGAITYKPLSTHVNDVLTAELRSWNIRMLGDPVVVDGLRGDPAFCAVNVPSVPESAPPERARDDAASYVRGLTEARNDDFSLAFVKSMSERTQNFLRSLVTPEPATPTPPGLRSVGGVAPDEPTAAATQRLGLRSLGGFLLDATVFVWSAAGWQPEPSAGGGRAYDVIDIETNADAGRLRAHVRFSAPGAWHFVQTAAARPAGVRVHAPAWLAGRGGAGLRDRPRVRSRRIRHRSAGLALGPQQRTAGRAAEMYAASLRPGAAPPLGDDVPADAPLARTVVAMLAFRNDRLAQLDPARIDELALSSAYSDAAVFRLRTLVDQSENFDTRAALPYVTALARNGSPFTTEGFGQIVRLFELFFTPGPGGEPPLLDAHDESLLPATWQRFREHVAAIARSFRGSGLFVSFASTAEQMKLILGSIV